MKRFLGYLLGIALFAFGVVGIACEISEPHFAFFGYAFACVFLFGGILLIWGVRSHYGGGLWSGLGYILTANAISDAFLSLDHFLQKRDPPNSLDFFICSVCLVLGIAFLNQGHKRHLRLSADESPLNLESQPPPQRLLRSAPWAPAWLGVIFGVWFTWHYFSTGYKLYEFGEAWKREGLPLTHDEIDNWYPPVPPTQNAALIYQQAITNLVEADFPAIRRLAHAMVKADRAEFDSEQGRVQGVLSHHRKALDLLYAATTNSQSRYPIVLDKRMQPDHSYLGQLAISADLLALETLERGFNGDTDKAIDSITAILALSDSLAKEPFFASQNCRLFCNVRAASQIQWILQSCKLNDVQLRRLEDGLRKAEQITDLSGAYIVNFCDAMRAEPFACIDQGFQHPIGAAISKAIALLTDRKSVDKLYYANSVRTCLKALKNPYPLRLQMLPDSKSSKGYTLHHGYFVSAYFVGWRREFSLAAAEDCALLRNLQTAVAIERYRIAYQGDTPLKLNELCPRFLAAVPEDPFDGYPLRYQQHSQDFGVYSIGKDMKDNGGKVWQRGQNENEPYDVVVRVEHKNASNAVTSTRN